jgi:4-hydroxybenzoate polyprenyltransferase
MVAAFLINRLCFFLSPVALLVILGYSYTKRFTWFCHFVLGLGLSLAPVGAYLAVAATFSWAPVVLGLAVLSWVAGFDIIYALQDEQFDRNNSLYSVPVWLGGKKALFLSSSTHLFSAGFLILSVVLMQSALGTLGLGFIWLGTLLFLGLLFYQHTLVKPGDLRRVNLAFFTTNGVASLVFGFFAILEFLIG